MSISRHTSSSIELRLVDFTADDPFPREGAYRFAHAETSPPHSHALGHLVHAASGVLSLMTEEGTWIAPSTRFAWVPAGLTHRHRAHGRTDMRIIHLDDDLASSLPAGPAVLVATPLAREAALAMTSGRSRGEEALDHLRRVIVDEAVTAPEQPLHLPVPHDPRLRHIARIVEEELSAPATLGDLGARVGASERTLSRLFPLETGMGFRQWRLQLRVHRALVLLADGVSVTDTAAACGWATTSQFIAQFTPLVGTTPGRYRQSQPAS
ncbi:helix-turn-helix transcriptional regulator [Streptomyces sp. AC495_CC817]|uniref:AraC family transcriptional regulator n=1 Tax=Streptomyces sp. AC495_CC817 TaxID=2823900 RepID=UPI001C25C14A|nr:helix-turn-helix transcriptional regulator [Streptomyces sp. AC495_CC817]